MYDWNYHILNVLKKRGIRQIPSIINASTLSIQFNKTRYNIHTDLGCLPDTLGIFGYRPNDRSKLF